MWQDSILASLKTPYSEPSQAESIPLFESFDSDLHFCASEEESVRQMSMRVQAPNQEEPVQPKKRRMRRHSQSKRDYTTIVKVIYTQLKWKLADSRCPIDMKPFWEVVSFRRNQRTLADLEFPFLYAEHMEHQNSGSLRKFKEYLLEIKPALLEAATLKYAKKNRGKMATFTEYLERAYKAYFSGRDRSGRLAILYQDPGHLQEAIRKAAKLETRFASL